MTAERPQHDATMSRRSCGCESCHDWRHRLCVVVCDVDCPAPPLPVEVIQTATGFQTRTLSMRHWRNL